MTSPPVIQPALYRAAQFLVALRAYLPAWAGGGLTAADQALVAAILTTPAQRHLFARMSPNDQRHAVAVVRTLRQAGYDNLALLQAALLHDVAKSLGQPIVHRVVIVLLEAFWPAALQRLSTLPHSRERGGGGWRRPFVVHAHHPAIGAAWAAAAKCDPVAVKLIARHQESVPGEPVEAEEKLLAALQWADNLN